MTSQRIAPEILAARLVEEVHEGDDLDSLAETIGGLIDGPIKTALLEWAARPAPAIGQASEPS
jgi:hypothetical protein